MQDADIQLKDFFRRELDALRSDAVSFAEAYPGAASALALNQGRSGDPQVEMLLQSFAYLAARLQYQIEADQATLPNTLMDMLYPHLAAPVPSMLIAKIDAPQSKGAPLPRGSQMHASVRDELNREVSCRFRTCYETPLWPVTIADIKLDS